jgi:cytochrome P450
VPLSEQTITSEATVAIVAGSHTTSSSLGHALFYLLANPDDFSKLRVELDDAAVASVPDAATSAQVEGISLDVLEKLPFLNAVM